MPDVRAASDKLPTAAVDLSRHCTDERFLACLESTLPEPSHPMYERWKQFHLSGLARGVNALTTLGRYLPARRLDVLDLGSGMGGLSVAAALMGHTVTGVELDPNRVEVAHALADCYGVEVSFHVGDATKTGLPDSSFDLVLMADLVEHVPDVRALFAEVARLLRPHGVAHIAGPQRWSPLGLFRDPHYGLFGVSVLPKSLASWYVVRVRRRAERYDSETLPSISAIRRWAKEAGLTPVVITEHYLRRRIEEADGSHRVARQLAQWVLKAGVPLSLMANLTLHAEVLAWKGTPEGE